MKVLQVNNSLYIGGAEKLLVDSIPIYKQKGIDMELLLLTGIKTPFFELLEKQGVKIYALTKGNFRKIYNPFLCFRIIPYLKKYDIIHVHLFPALYWVALAKIISHSQTKLIFTEHSTNNRRIGNKTGQIFDKFIYNQYSSIVSITKEIDSIIKTHLALSSKKFKIINNGIDLTKFTESLRNNEMDKSKITIIQISSFQEPKDQPTLIRAMKYLPKNVFLLLVGDGETRSKCEQSVKELNLLQKVSFLGIRTDIPQLLKSSDIAVLSSRFEGLSLSCIEAMASGKPLVASDVPGLSEMVAGAGLLFPPGNEKALAEQINMLIANPDLYKKVSQACFERSKQYDINVMVDKYIELYKEVINN